MWHEKLKFALTLEMIQEIKAVKQIHLLHIFGLLMTDSAVFKYMLHMLKTSTVTHINQEK